MQIARVSVGGRSLDGHKAKPQKHRDPHRSLTLFQQRLLESQSFDLMGLPLELREKVYLEVFVAASSDSLPSAHAQATESRSSERLITLETSLSLLHVDR